jgi:large subunit ribosomal protein L29
MKAEDVRKMKSEELKVQIATLRERLFDLRTQTVAEKVEKVSEFRVIRRDIARLLTERRARQLARGAAK